MKDERLTKLAERLIHHSLRLQAKERVLIRGPIAAKALLKELIDEAYRMGAYPYAELEDDEITSHLLRGNVKEQLDTLSEWNYKKYEDVDAVIIVSGEGSEERGAIVPPERYHLQEDAMKSSTLFFVNHRRWVLLNFPTIGSAKKAGMSFEQYEDFLLNVCTMDYRKMERAMKPLKEWMERTDRVRILSPGTDLTFSIKNIPAVICAGKNNLPDGEVFTAPVKDSVNGTISFNTSSAYQGDVFHDITLSFQAGKIVKATSNQPDKMNRLLDGDEGARYVGEFAMGVNPYILEPMGDILFDEKISGSLHLATGQAYQEADNENRSSLHWDMVLIQRPEYGGGNIYFDDILIRKDGLFVPPELCHLNPEQLK